MTTMAKAITKMMEMLLMEMKNIPRNTLWLILEMFMKRISLINHEIINGINGPVAMRPIGNMHINEDKYFGFGKHGYNRADEIPNDDYYNDVDNDHGKENGNKGGCNNDSNNRGEGGASGTMVGGNNDATSIGNGDGEPSNTSQEEPIEEGPNQAVEL
jgi:hypothetical protein